MPVAESRPSKARARAAERPQHTKRDGLFKSAMCHSRGFRGKNYVLAIRIQHFHDFFYFFCFFE